MAGKITIDTERCKGCGLCIVVCPHNCIVVSEQSNNNGYLPAASDSKGCTGCANCAVVCPDAAIEVAKDVRIIAIDKAEVSKRSLAKEKV